MTAELCEVKRRVATALRDRFSAFTGRFWNRLGTKLQPKVAGKQKGGSKAAPLNEINEILKWKAKLSFLRQACPLEECSVVAESLCCAKRQTCPL